MPSYHVETAIGTGTRVEAARYSGGEDVASGLIDFFDDNEEVVFTIPKARVLYIKRVDAEKRTWAATTADMA